MIEILRKLYKSPDSVEALEATLAQLNADCDRATNDREAAERSYGDRLLTVKTPDDVERLDAKLKGLQSEEHRLHAARTAVSHRLDAALAARAERILQAQWDACKAALTRRGEAFAKLQQAANAYGKAFIEAEDAAREAWTLLPVRKIPASAAAAETDLTGDFCSLDVIGHRLLEVASHRADGPCNSRVWEFQQGPTILQQHEAAASTWLRARIRRDEPTPDLPTAA